MVSASKSGFWICWPPVATKHSSSAGSCAPTIAATAARMTRWRIVAGCRANGRPRVTLGRSREGGGRTRRQNRKWPPPSSPTLNRKAISRPRASSHLPCCPAGLFDTMVRVGTVQGATMQCSTLQRPGCEGVDAVTIAVHGAVDLFFCRSIPVAARIDIALSLFRSVN